MKWTIVFSLFLSMTSCDFQTQVDGINNEFATHFSIENDRVFTYAQGKILSKVSVKTIPNKIAIFSSSHAGFIAELSENERVKIVSDKKYFFNTAYIASTIEEVGDMTHINMEKLVSYQPDLVILLPSSLPDNKLLEVLQVANIPYLITNEYSEKSPLGQAEWIKLYSAVFHKKKIGDSIFASVKEKYQAIEKQQKNTDTKLVFTGFPWKNQWYVSDANSIFAQCIYDAGGKYLVDSSQNKNQPVSIEKVLHYMSQAQYWLNIGTVNSMLEVSNHLPYSSSFKSVILQQCYNNNKRVNRTGANDYWEQGIVRPDKILEDIYKILYTQDTSFYFYMKLE